MINLFFLDLTPNGTETEELLADAYAVKRTGSDANIKEDEMTRVDSEGSIGSLAEQTLSDCGGESEDSLEGATLTPTKAQQLKTEEKELSGVREEVAECTEYVEKSFQY